MTKRTYDSQSLRTLAEEDMRKTLTKVQQKKIMKVTGKTLTGQVPDPVTLEPQKADIRGPGVG